MQGPRAFTKTSTKFMKHTSSKTLCVNFMFASHEASLLEEVSKLGGFELSKQIERGNLFWHYLKIPQKDFMKLAQRKCYFNRYPQLNVLCKKYKFF